MIIATRQNVFYAVNVGHVMLPMTEKKIANFIAQNAFSADKIVMTDFCDRLICESITSSFLMNCPNQNMCREIIPYLIPIQMDEVQPEDFLVATREEMEAVWNAEEEMVMAAEIRML